MRLSASLKENDLPLCMRGGQGERRKGVGERRSKEKMRKMIENDRKVKKHYHLIEYINIIHDKNETGNINDQ